jgi:hypothetical protein
MTKTVPLKKMPLVPRVCAGLVSLSLTMFMHGAGYASAGFPPGMQNPSTSVHTYGDTIHSIKVNKSLKSKKGRIELYPDARQQVLFFSAKGKDGNNETTVLTNISGGNFLYEVFSDDERIENGNLTVR